MQAAQQLSLWEPVEQQRKTSARQWVIDGQRTCLPRGCSLPFTIETANFTKKNVALAHVRMFDGLPGVVQVSQVSYGFCSGWRIHWQDLPGGDVNWNGKCWERVLTPLGKVEE